MTMLFYISPKKEVPTYCGRVCKNALEKLIFSDFSTAPQTEKILNLFDYIFFNIQENINEKDRYVYQDRKMIQNPLT